jgi:hypothetical protein
MRQRKCCWRVVDDEVGNEIAPAKRGNVLDYQLISQARRVSQQHLETGDQ